MEYAVPDAPEPALDGGDLADFTIEGEDVEGAEDSEDEIYYPESEDSDELGYGDEDYE